MTTPNAAPDQSPGDQSTLSKMQKVRQLRRVYVRYPSAEPIFEVLDRLYNYGSLAGESGGSAKCVLLTGESRSGKSALLHKWQARRPPSVEGDVDHRPVLYVETPHNCTPKGLSRAILRELGVPDLITTRATNDSLLHQVDIHLKAQRVKVIILDELQHFIDSANRRVINSSAEFLKSLLNMGKCSFVLAGIPSAVAVIEENDQLEGRMLSRFHLSGFDLSVPQQKAEYQAIIKAFGDQLPFELPSNLQLLAPKLARATKGSLGRSIDLIVNATEIALDQNAKSLEVQHLREALDLRHGGPSTGFLNPFDETAAVSH